MKNFYFGLLFVGFSFYCSAQDLGGTAVQGVTPIKRVLQAETTAKKGTAKTVATSADTARLATSPTPTSTSEEVGITEGQLSVSLSGGASYSVPIAVPPGINGVVPQVGLVYNSQGGNGQAGYGWNISGVSAITRIPRTKFHDGVVGGVNLDTNDRFAFDGQRLILKSVASYGAAGAIYETENFSNLKITSVGVSPLGDKYGPASFKIEYPDGSVAEYGSTTDSRSITTWSISYWQNAQGLRISYNYILANNTLSIEYIKYGSTTSNAPINQIKFVYKTRQRPEQSYLGGQSILMNTILSEIQVLGNAVGFRNYVLETVKTTLGYERLKSITEKSGDNLKSYNPTVFSYGGTNSSGTFVVNPNKPQIGLSNINANNASTVVADFDGDGKNDFIVYAKKGPDAFKKYWIYNDVYGSSLDTGSEHNTGNFTDIFATSYLKGDASNGYKLSPSQGWTVAKNNGTNYTFDTYALIPVSAASGYNYYPALQYTKMLSFPTDVVQNCRETDTVMFPKKILSGDFNGDGLTDVIAIDNDPIYSVDCDNYNDYTTTIYSQGVYFVDLKKDVSNSVTSIGQINERIHTASKVEVIDFNSDGKSDFMVLTEGKVTVYTLGTTNNLIVLATYTDAGLKVDKPCLLGDYNGDGKTDFVIPQAVGKDIWCFYQATGSSSGFVKKQKSISENYTTNYTTETDIDGDWHRRQVEIIEYNYFANDLNGDGKTDIVKVFNQTFDHINNYTTSYGRQKYIGSNYENQGNPIHSSIRLLDNFDVVEGQYYQVYETRISGIHTYPIPLTTNHTQPNLKLEFSLLTDNTIYTFNCTKDNREDSRLASVTTGNGVKETITYKPLIDDYDYELSVYTPVLDKSVYPYTDIAVAPGLQVVSMLEKQSASVYKKQLFAYAGATSNLEGLGFLGFRTSMRTNWFEDDAQIISTTSKFDPNLRGAYVANYTYLGLVAPTIAVNTPAANANGTSAITINDTRTATETVQATNSITFLPGATIAPSAGSIFIATITPDYDVNGYAETNTSPPSNLISKSLSFYEASLSPTKVYKLQNTKSNTYNILENTSSETTMDYDTYNNLTESISKVRNAGISEQTLTTTIAYQSPYISSRPISKTQTVSISDDSMTSTETYGYGTGSEINLLKTIQKWGNNTSAITENNTYDSFGNITKKTISASEITDRETSFKYDATGRFLTESYDIEALKTTYVYNTEGTLKSETNPYGLTTSYLYDSWFKNITTTNYLGKTNTLAYIRQNEKTLITSTGGDDGSYSEALYDELGRKIRTGVKDIENNMSYKDFKYDIYDRNYSVSEAYAASPLLWNTTTYDVYGRAETATSFTGKVLSMSYDALTTTVTDGSTGQVKTTTKNAMGNVITMLEAPIGGTVIYSYFANGNIKETDYNGTKITISQNGWGRKTSLKDPSAGTYTYEYNALGESTKEATPNGTTTYVLDLATGKLTSKTISGTNTNSSTVYTYDVNKMLQNTVYTDATGTSNTITTDYTYDDQKRLLNTVEKSSTYGTTFTKILTYDAWGRVATETSKAELNGKSSEKLIQNDYTNGFAYKITDTQSPNPKILWQTSEVNAKGQLTKAHLGNGIIINNKYDSYGYVTNMKHSLGTATTMELATNFDSQRGNLIWRKNSLFGNIQEDFAYDNQDRLLTYPNALSVIVSQSYEDDGRIKANSLGKYIYKNTDKIYQNTSIELTPEATGYYANREGGFNDSMEDEKGWLIYDPAVYSYDTTEKHSGKTSLKIANTTTAEKVIHSVVWTKIDNTVPTSYTYSAWVKSDGPQAELFLFMKTETETNYFTLVDSKFTNVKNQWTRIEGTFTVPAHIKKLNLRLNNNGLGNVWFDDVMIRKTNNAALVNLQVPDATYQDRQLNISYNTFKSPVEISEAGVDKLSFVYNDNNSRSVMFYGSLDIDKNLRPNRKYYSADGTMEIKQNILSGATEFVTYHGGDGYSAPVIYKKTYNTAGTAQEQMLYLHRDYQGSIVAITNDAGAILEKRQFDAWGDIIKVQDGKGNALAGLTILDRGYTGHEHLQSVGLINMNGRLYDPKLHRFLQPDNYIQDPSNTQNYNRYGYVLNNALKYTDPSGETSNCTTCPEKGGLSDAEQQGLGSLISSLFQNSWVSNNFSARNFDQAGTAVGKGFRDATNWVTSGVAGLFGNYRSAPAVNVRSNANVSSWSGGSANAIGQGSFMDYFSRFVYETDQFNPIALAWDGIKGNITGTDRYNNELSGFDSNMKIVSAVPMTKVAGIMTNVTERFILSEARNISSKSAQFVIYNSKYLNTNNWMRLGVGSNATNDARVIRLSLGAGPKAYEAMSPGIMKSFNGWLKTINTNGHFYFPWWY